MILNFVLNNSVTYRDRRLRGWAFWGGLLTFCLACGLGVAANVAISNEAFHRGVPWVLAALTGLLFSAVWNYGVTSMTTWRQARRSSEQRAKRRMQAAANVARHEPAERRTEKHAGEDDLSVASSPLRRALGLPAARRSRRILKRR